MLVGIALVALPVVALPVGSATVAGLRPMSGEVVVAHHASCVVPDPCPAGPVRRFADRASSPAAPPDVEPVRTRLLPGAR